jgi:8-oxo-dGTP pyrophosphatase MutT (NUDIX family)
MSEATPLPASTVVLVRDGASGPEVLLLQRNLQSGFMPGMYLFPGGAVDQADASAEAFALCVGLDDTAASSALSMARGGLANWVAAIREAFEEANLLIACDARGDMIGPAAIAASDRFRACREALNAGTGDFIGMLRAEGLTLPVDRLAFFSQWITPVGAPRRYDTRFFVARAPEGQDALHDNVETVAYAWMHPAAALEGYRRGELKMRTPTWKTLERLADFLSADELIGALRRERPGPALLPRIDKSGRRLLPGDPGYEEAGSPEGRGEWRT